MTSTGLLQHEGTSVPRDPKNPSMSSVMFVLDIKDIALQPNREMPLTIRKPDERRKSTQTWKFIVSLEAFICFLLSTSAVLPYF